MPSALAYAPTIEIPQSQVSGSTSTSLLEINVGNGNGVNISFYNLKETIKKIWLDDPSEILVDVDGCLEGISSSSCGKNVGLGAGLIHLRRIQKVSIPGLPHTAVTLLTVVTETSAKERKIYQFQVLPGKTQHTEYVVIADRKITHLQPVVSNFILINSVKNGITAAMNKKLLRQSDPLYSRLQKFIAYLSQGDETSIAANKASISMSLVNRLIQMGQQRGVKEERRNL